MSKTGVIDIISIFYIIVIITQLFKKIEEHGKCMLGYCFGGISGNIAPGNAAGSQIVFIQIIGSGSSNTDKLQMRCGMDCLFVNRNFIDNQNVCVLDPFRCFFRCGKVVSGDSPSASNPERSISSPIVFASKNTIFIISSSFHNEITALPDTDIYHIGSI